MDKYSPPKLPPSFKPQVLLKRLQYPDNDLPKQRLTSNVSLKGKDIHKYITGDKMPNKKPGRKTILQTKSHAKTLTPQVTYQQRKCDSNRLAVPPLHTTVLPTQEKEKATSPILPHDKVTLINPEIDIPQTLPPVEIPPPQAENIDTYRSPDNFLYKKPLPVLKDSKELDIFSRHIPKQKEIDEFLSVLKAKVTKDYKLPLLAKSIINAYTHSPAFKNIYQYITTNTLPPNRRLQRSIISNADNYIVADGLLFKLQQTYRNRQMVHRCLLVIPETFEHVVFHLYHDSLLGVLHTQFTRQTQQLCSIL